MRAVILILLGFSWTGALAAESSSSTPPAKMPTLLPTSGAGQPKLAPSNSAASTLFNPGQSVPSNYLRPAPAEESHTAAQLEELLKAYVGHWRGETFVRIVGGTHLIHFPIESVYTLVTEKGVKVLQCSTSYLAEGQMTVEHSRMWVEGGQIVSEVVQGNTVTHYIARLRGESLVWFTHDPDKALTDYSQTETLKLTASGGTLSMQGFEVTPTTGGFVIECEGSELKLVK